MHWFSEVEGHINPEYFGPLHKRFDVWFGTRADTYN